MIEIITQDSQPRELWIQIVDNLSCYYDKEVGEIMSLLHLQLVNMENLQRKICVK